MEATVPVSSSNISFVLYDYPLTKSYLYSDVVLEIKHGYLSLMHFSLVSSKSTVMTVVLLNLLFTEASVVNMFDSI